MEQITKYSTENCIRSEIERVRDKKAGAKAVKKIQIFPFVGGNVMAKGLVRRRGEKQKTPFPFLKNSTLDNLILAWNPTLRIPTESEL